jgi:Transposase domain (DUF772).
MSRPNTRFGVVSAFSVFWGLGWKPEAVPDHTTLWLFRESLAQAQLTERLFTTFHTFLREAGYAARAGQIIDASFVTVPRQNACVAKVGNR